MVANEQQIATSWTSRLAIWVCRILIGSTFIISGWSKSIDPWGFIYKINEYFAVWGVELPRELALTASISLSSVEFVIGVAIFTGIIRHLSCWLAAMFIAFMLPLTVYIAMADPVSDCGCFGDFIILSNPMTLVKNIILTALIVYLLFNNFKTKGLYPESSQWIPLVVSFLFTFTLSFIGYRYQPLVDFRPYSVGTTLVRNAADSDVDTSGNPVFIYEKDGAKSEFTLDNLPDSSWTFVESRDIDGITGNTSRFVITDGENDITEEVVDSNDNLLLLTVSNPGTNYFTRARLANELAAYMENGGAKMIGIVAEDDGADTWIEMALPDYDIYYAEDTDIKELVRGDVSVVYLHDGVITWKRNFATINHDILRESDSTKMFDGIDNIGNGRDNILITSIYLAIMLVAMIKIPNFAHRKQYKTT